MRPHLVSMLAAAILAIACTGAPVQSPTDAPDQAAWGPLAVSATANGDMARLEGALEITARCVFLVRANNRVLLIWPAAQTGWDEGTQTVLFTRTDGVALRLTNGHRVAVGGSGGALGIGGPPAELLDFVPWVAPPMPECGAPDYWWMGDVDVLREGP